MKYHHTTPENAPQIARRKQAPRARKGSFLIEATVSLFLLVVIAIVLLNSSLNILRPRTWVMRQNLVDAFLSQEVALANRIDFETIHTGGSVRIRVPGEDADRDLSWGGGVAATADIANAVTHNDVTMGFMPSFTLGGGGRAFEATVHRVRIPLMRSNAVAADSAATFSPDATGGETASADQLDLVDLGIRAYELQTHVVYTLGGNTYVRSRSVIRSQ